LTCGFPLPLLRELLPLVLLVVVLGPVEAAERLDRGVGPADHRLDAGLRLLRRAALLLRANATVTFCHTRTRDMAERTRKADLLVAAAGRAGLIQPEMVKPGATVVDVGITRTPEGLVGDVDKRVLEVAGLLTPVPGGVGPMTRAMLLANTVRAARVRRGLLAFD